ncbi:MAG: hypothetical protein Q7S57_05150 [bacterium]|nr:hypothetical protein [bacterium]
MIDQLKAKSAYDAYLEKARNDDRIIGVILGGGRGKGAASENSDYDVILVTTDAGFEGVKNDYPKTEYIDSLPHSLSGFREHAKIGSTTQYDKYTFAHNKAIIDKTGEIQKLIDEKGTLDPTDARKIASTALGGYLNQIHRSLKNLRDGNELAGRLDANESIPLLLQFVFAVENKVCPYNKFLVWELTNYPLEKLPISSDNLITKIQSIIQRADFETQKELLAVIRKLALENGFNAEIEDWNGYYFG